MEWRYQHLQWLAPSKKRDDDGPLYWMIVSTREDGLFYVNESHPQLTMHNEGFESLKAAKDFCERIESGLVEIVDGIIHDNDNVSAWFSKNYLSSDKVCERCKKPETETGSIGISYLTEPSQVICGECMEYLANEHRLFEASRVNTFLKSKEQQ